MPAEVVIGLTTLAIVLIVLAAYWVFIFPFVFIARHTSRLVVYGGFLIGLLGFLAYKGLLPETAAGYLISDLPWSVTVREFAFAHGFSAPLGITFYGLNEWYKYLLQIYQHIGVIFVQSFIWNCELMVLLIGIAILIKVIFVRRRSN